MRTISIIGLSIVAAAGLAAPATAFAATPTNSAQVKYCIKSEPLTGSRVRTTKCLTKAEWAKRGVDIANLDRQ